MRRQIEMVADKVLKECNFGVGGDADYEDYLKSLFVEFFNDIEYKYKLGPFTSGDLRKAFGSALDEYTAKNYEFRERSL